MWPYQVLCAIAQILVWCREVSKMLTFLEYLTIAQTCVNIYLF